MREPGQVKLPEMWIENMPAKVFKDPYRNKMFKLLDTVLKNAQIT